MPGVKAPETIKDLYTKDEVYPLAFKFYVDKSEKLIDVPGIPDFKAVKKNLYTALDYATTTQLKKIACDRLTGMDLLRLALERSASASEAMEWMVRLLSDHGQGGVCGYEDKHMAYHNSYIIADPGEAWVFETAGPMWAALRVRSHYTISNMLTLGEEYDECHPELIETARRRGWLRKGRTFHFAACYSDWFYTTFSAAGRRR